MTFCANIFRIFDAKTTIMIRSGTMCSRVVARSTTNSRDRGNYHNKDVVFNCFIHCKDLFAVFNFTSARPARVWRGERGKGCTLGMFFVHNCILQPPFALEPLLTLICLNVNLVNIALCVTCCDGPLPRKVRIDGARTASYIRTCVVIFKCHTVSAT